MPATFDYKVRDRTGALVTGQLVGDSEALVMQRLREMGMTPVRGQEGLHRLEDGDQPAAGSRQAEADRGLLPAVRDDGELGSADPAGALDPRRIRPRTRSSPRSCSPSGRTSSRARRCRPRWPSIPRRSTTCSSRWSRRARPAVSSTTCSCPLADQIEREVELRRQIKSAMTYPVVVVAIVMLILAAMLLFVVPQFETIYATLGGTLPLPTGCSWACPGPSRSYWYIVVSGRCVASFLFRRYKETDDGRARVDAVEAQDPRVRPPVPQGGPRPVRLDARRCCSDPASRSSRRSTT